MKNRQSRKLLGSFFSILPVFSLAVLPIVSSAEHSVPADDMVIPIIILLFCLLILRSLKVKKYSILFVVLFLLAVISTSFSDFTQSSNILFNYLLMCILCILSSAICLSNEDFRKFEKIYVVLGLFCALVIICSYIFGIEYQWGRYSMDIIGIKKNPNYIDSVIVLSMAILFDLLINKKISYKLALPVAISMIFGIILTGTRAATITAVVLTAIFILYILIKRKKLIWGIIAMLAIVPIMIVATDFLPTYTVKRVSGDGLLKDDTRMMMWSEAFDLYRNKNILFGIGLGATTINARAEGFPFDNIHNVMLQFLCEQGVIGLVVFLFLMYNICKRPLKEKKVFLIMFIIALYVPIMFQNGIVGYTFWWPIIFLMIFSNVGLKNEEA